tara:strand:- start:191 stop:904 length:714 start_codon:yes stop_codon:yes gene_type:complete
MKILIPLLLLTLGVNANEVVYGHTSGSVDATEFTGNDRFASRAKIAQTYGDAVILELSAGELFELGSFSAQIQYTLRGDSFASTYIDLALFTQRDGKPALKLLDLRVDNGFGLVGSGLTDGEAVIAAQKFIVGPCKILVAPNRPTVPWPNSGRDDEVSDFGDFKFFYDFSYKITKPSAAGTTTSAPILLPPTQDAAKSWFVKLQVSSDLKAWDDVAPGQFLGSDTARFFRIQTNEAE